MAASTIINTGWTAAELRVLADQMKQATADKDQKMVVTMTILGNTVSTSTKPTITLGINGVDTILKG